MLIMVTANDNGRAAREACATSEMMVSVEQASGRMSLTGAAVGLAPIA